MGADHAHGLAGGPRYDDVVLAAVVAGVAAQRAIAAGLGGRRAAASVASGERYAALAAALQHQPGTAEGARNSTHPGSRWKRAAVPGRDVADGEGDGRYEKHRGGHSRSPQHAHCFPPFPTYEPTI